MHIGLEITKPLLYLGYKMCILGDTQAFNGYAKPYQMPGLLGE